MLRTATAEEILPFVERAAHFRAADSTETAQAMAQSGGFLLTQNGQAFAGFSVKDCGPELWITAAGGSSRHDLTQVLFAVIEACAAGFRSIGFQTVRPGLIRKAQRHGYRVAGRNGEITIMRKAIQ